MNTLRAPIHIPFLILVTAILISCANQLPPEGGPIDTTPPTIVSTFPPPNTLHFQDNRLDLEFDKYVDHRSAEESIFISPYVGDLEFDWSGKEVEATFSGKLRKNTTYVVNVGTDVKDLRSPANRMAQAFTFAFSTGADIDRGGIRGKIFSVKSSDASAGVMIFAYQLTGMNPDTLDPRTLKPDYITQTGTGGDFYLQHLAFGPYRIFAVRDEYRNLLYDRQVDEFGVPAHDIFLTATDTLEENVLMQLSKEDTTAPRLVAVDPHNFHHLTFEFSEAIDTSSGAPFVVSIVDTLTRDQLKVFSVFPSQPSLSNFTLVTAIQDSTRGYRLTIDSVRDLAKNLIGREANSLVFTGSNVADTLVPKITSTSIQDSAVGVVLRPTIDIWFSDAVQRRSFSDAVVLKDTSGNVVPTSLNWMNDASCELQVRNELSSKSGYRLSILTENGVDCLGRKFRDSVKVIRFETLDAETLSSIEGVVVDTNEAEKKAPIIVTAEGVDQKSKKSYTTVAKQNGNFMIGEIGEGRYVVHAFRDRNLNGMYDAGCPYPFMGSERFGYASDTLKVRARWPLEGVRIDLK
jgi:hypothetical protein